MTHLASLSDAFATPLAEPDMRWEDWAEGRTVALPPVELIRQASSEIQDLLAGLAQEVGQ